MDFLLRGALAALCLAAILLKAQGQSYGIDQSPPIGPFLGGRLPERSAAIPQASPTLSALGAFRDLATLTPLAGVIPYDINSPLWSDGAAKQRWLAIPSDGQRDSPTEKIGFSPAGDWVFPVGSVFIKHFELPTNEANPEQRRRLETRFLVHGVDGAYYGLTYRWLADGSDAQLLPEDGGSDVIAIATAQGGTRQQSWKYPSRADCLFCHNQAVGGVIGPRTHQLNRDFLYASGRSDNQLRTLNHLGLFSPALEEARIVDMPRSADLANATRSLEDRARSYLDANCAHCHRPSGTNAGFDARFTTPLEKQGLLNGNLLYTNGIEGAKLILPRQPELSMVWLRLNYQGEEQMPPVGRSVVHNAALAVVRDWIMSLPPDQLGENRPPSARDDAVAVGYGLSATFDPLANDSDPNGDALRLSSFTQPLSGRVTADSAGRLTYVPNQGFSGIDTQRYRARDPSGAESNEAVISWHVASPNGASGLSFTDRSVLLANRTVRSGVALAVTDLNGDGRDDLARLHLARALVLDWQKADGSFEGKSLATESTDQWTISAADLDGDGFQEIATVGLEDGLKFFQTHSSGQDYSRSLLTAPAFFGQGSNFADINRDGLLDLFVCNDRAENLAFRNQAGSLVLDGSMIDTRTRAPSDNSGNYGSVWTDYDGDGDLDLYLSKCRARVSDPRDPRRINMLLRNDRQAGYTEVAASVGLALGDQSWAADFGDIDNDGDLDCFVANHGSASRLFRNDAGQFTDITAPANISVGFTVMQCLFRDFDNDGWQDLLLTGTRHRLYRNRRDGTFVENADLFPGATIESFAVGDLNQDGFLDILAGYAEIYNTPSTTADRLFLNNRNSNGQITLRLLGPANNRQGIGARVYLEGPWGRQTREVRAGESYSIVNSAIQRFGMGSAALAAKLSVHWPSGVVDTIANIGPNRAILLREGASALPTIGNPGPQKNPALRSLRLAIQASDPTGDPLRYSALRLPPGLSIDSATGLISGTPSTPGVYDVLLRVADEFGYSELALAWEITPDTRAWANWQRYTPGAGTEPASDDDEDGQSDLEEFALGTEPDSGWRGGGLRLDTTPTSIRLSFRRPLGLQALSYALESSLDARQWQPENRSFQIFPLPEERELLWQDLSRDFVGFRFFRLKITLADPAARIETKPVGICQTSFTKGRQTHGASLMPPAEYASRVTANSSDSIVPSAADTLSWDAAPRYLEIIDGPHAGQRWDLRAGNGLRVLLGSAQSARSALPPDLAGSRFVVRPHHTLAGLYPASEFLSGPNINESDQIILLEDGQFSPHWRRGDGHWATSANVLADDIVLPPGRGCFVNLAQEKLLLAAIGEPRENTFREAPLLGPRLLAAPFARDLTWTQRGFVSSNGLLSHPDPALASTLQVWKGDALPGARGFLSYFLTGPAQDSHWRLLQDTSLAPQDGKVLPADRAILLRPGVPTLPGWIVLPP